MAGSRRRIIAVAVAALLVLPAAPAGGAGVSTPGSAGISSHTPGSFPFCSASVTSSCISSFLVDGAAAPAAITVETILQAGGSGAPSFFAFMLQRNSDGSFELSPSLTTSSKVTIAAKLPSTFTPNVATVLGTVDSWQWDSATREVTITAFPRAASWLQAAPGCTPGPGNCPDNADTDFTAVLLIGIVDANYNPLFASKFQGGFLSFNSQVFSTPTFNPATSAVEFIVGAPANKASGAAQTTSFKVFIPDAVITDLWLLADPATLPAAFTRTTISGLAEVTPTRTRVTATATSPGGWIFEYGPFNFSVRNISIGPADAPAAANPFALGTIVDFPNCGGGTTTDCIASFTVNGGSAPPAVALRVYTMGDGLQLQLFRSGSFELSPALSASSVVDVKVNLGPSFTPVVLFGAGSVSSWTWNDATRQVTVTAKPVSASFANQCDIFQCAQTADFDVTAVLMLGAGAFTIPAGLPAGVAAELATAKAQLQGAFFSTNAQNFTPPKYDQVAKAIKFRLAAPHLRQAGGLNTGSVSTLIPDGVIVNQWGIADPTTLTGSGVKFDIEGLGTVVPQATHVTATATSPAGILIQYQGFSYSTPLVSIAKGTVASVAPPPAAEITLPTTGSGGPVSSAILPVRLPSSGVIPVPLTLSETVRGAKAVFASGTKVTRRSTGAAFSGLLYTPAAIEDPTGGKLASATSLGAEGLIREAASDLALSTPLTLTLPVPAGDAAKLQPARVTSTGSLVYLLGTKDAGSVRIETDRLGVYGLARLSNAGVIDEALQVPSSGMVSDAIAMSAAGARLDLAAGTALTAGGAAYAGELAKPAAAADPTKGALSSVVSFGATGTDIKLSRTATITLPLPSGADSASLQPVAIDAEGRLTYLLGRAVTGGVAFETDHLSTFALAKVARPPVRTVDREFVREPGFHSRWAGQSDTVELAPGQLVDLAVRLRNTGGRAWVSGSSGAQARLGSSAPLDNTRDFERGVLVDPVPGTQNRYAEPDTAEVGPGAVATFAMRLRAPSSMGAYRIYLRPVIEGVTWLEDEGIYLEVAVR